MPDHVVPPQFITIVSISNKIEAKQGSLVTIFSLWNTMMGTSILSIPWALKMAGFANGVVLLILMAALMCYSAYRIISITHGMANYGYLDFSDVCQHYLGKFGLYTAIICSLMSLVGGMIVYWILMSNFLYNTVSFFAILCPSNDNTTSNVTDQLSVNFEDLYTLSKSEINVKVYNKIWDLTTTVPVFLLLLLFPLLNFKSPTFFTKFNSLATISVTYLMIFTVVKATKWGVNIEFKDKFSEHYSPNISSNLAALTGIAALAYFIHNCVLSILRSHKKPENGVRDLGIAFFLVCFTYIFIGVGLYISFPLQKSCIQDNILNNLPLDDNLAFAARACMLLQMVAVFPLLIYVFRVQFFHVVSGNIYPGVLKVVLMNLLMCAISILFACFLPKIGKVIGFVGAFCGFSYALGLPFLIHLIALYEKHQLTWYSFTIHTFFILLGFANFIAQFFISGH
ncbi:sodium-coupled neutral amino acid transporter 9 isoform X2 [Octopus bimaculoides]|nr:sodium-coupled neutral amino acid transporter 9 isoform X2 [Octopus bimaculoides]|eukprot:XP_014784211.1 PREDICTED: sodium-coupled neutral amino acid transporter 9-like isoform X2 [Octopus bimaculoides]